MNPTHMPQPIPLPADFPVVWERPEDAHGFWERETMHLPGQSTMLDDSFARRWIDEGFNAACEDFSMPVRDSYRRVNTYVYQSIAPVSHDPAELEQLGLAAQERLGAAIGNQREVWERDRLPEIKRAARALARVRSRGRVRRGARRAPAGHGRVERARVAHPLPGRVPGDHLDEPLRRPLLRAARRRRRPRRVPAAAGPGQPLARRRSRSLRALAEGARLATTSRACSRRKPPERSWQSSGASPRAGRSSASSTRSSPSTAAGPRST